MVLRSVLVVALLACAAGCEIVQEMAGQQTGGKPHWSSTPPADLRTRRAPPPKTEEPATIPKGSSVAEVHEPSELAAPFATTR